LEQRLPHAAEQVEFDPEAGMFSASGPLEVLQQLGAELKSLFDDEQLLRDILSRARQE
jgi:hypothetical protein